MTVRKVAYLTPLYFGDQSYVGGGERYPLNLARGVVEGSEGACRVELVSFGDKAFTRELLPGVTLRVLTAARPPDNPLDVVSWEMPEAFADADLIHIHQAYTRCTEVGLLVAKQQRKPVCITDHGGFTSPLGMQLGTLDLADRIICQSEFAASFCRTRSPIVVIKGGVDARAFSPPLARPTRDRVLFVGRLLPHKGIDQLIRAMPADIPLTVCGRPYHPEYFELLKDLARHKRVEFVTEADDAAVRELYGRAWVNVLPSVYKDCYGTSHLVPELMGFTLLEAMACGTPVICSRVGAMPEFVREGETGFVFDDTSQLTEQIVRLAGDSSLAERMGNAARRDIEREYDLAVAGRRIWSVYQELLTDRKEAAA